MEWRIEIVLAEKAMSDGINFVRDLYSEINIGKRLCNFLNAYLRHGKEKF